MTDQKLGAAVRQVRIRRGLRQRDVASMAGVSRASISRCERGHVGSLSIDLVRAIGASLDIKVELVARWRAGELDRLLSARHSALHEIVARSFRDNLPAWILQPEVSFSVYGERGVVDIVAWHPGRRALLVIELKTDIADVNELIGAVDRKRRLGPTIAKNLGFEPVTVSTWVIVSPGRTNRRRVAAHGAMLRAAFPVDGRGMRRWLRDPVERVNGLSMWPNAHPGNVRADLTPIRRVRCRASAP